MSDAKEVRNSDKNADLMSDGAMASSHQDNRQDSEESFHGKLPDASDADNYRGIGAELMGDSFGSKTPRHSKGRQSRLSLNVKELATRVFKSGARTDTPKTEQLSNDDATLTREDTDRNARPTTSEQELDPEVKYLAERVLKAIEDKYNPPKERARELSWIKRPKPPRPADWI